MSTKIINPLRLNQNDVARLPRRYLFLLAALYALSGLTFRELWRQEADSFGIMLTMAKGTSDDWIQPNVAGHFSAEMGPLSYWIGAIFIKLLSGLLSPFAAAQLATAVQNGTAMGLLWLSVYRLGKRDEMQPQRMAFGGEPSPTDYGRMLADSAVLLLIATYGVAQYTHDTSEGATILMVCMMWLCGAVSSLARPLSGRWLWGAGFAGLALTLPFTLFIFFLFATLGLLFFTHWRSNSLDVAPVVISMGLIIPAIWLFNACQNADFLTEWLSFQHFKPLSSNNLLFFWRNIFVFTWPIAPLGIWCLWRWRSQWHNPMMALGLALLITPITHLIISGQRFDASMLLLIPGLVLLAPFGLATLNRGRANIIDWFSVLSFSTLALLIWLFWVAAWTGIPNDLAHNIFKLAPGFKMEFKWWPFLIATAVTVGWGFLLAWRIRFEPKALWKSVAFSSSGLVMVWTLLATLAMPWLDYTRSYKSTGQSLKATLPEKTTCVRGFELTDTVRGAMYYYANVPFVPEKSEFADVKCPYVLTNEQALHLKERSTLQQTVQWQNTLWQIIWRGERISDRDNAMVLLRQ